MIIDSIHIAKFHGFKDVGFKLGTNITIIAGQNGTQKTTLLGLLGQPFSLKSHPEMKDEKPLCGGSYWSQFSEKFKLSPPKYDKAGEHEWTVSFLTKDEPYTVISMWRDQKVNNDLRFWKKGSRDKGTGYRQYPVIFLSLKRLIPLAEEPSFHIKEDVALDESEKKLFKELHSEILFSFDNVIDTNIIASPNKTTTGFVTDTYDWMQNSAGQDNIGKIILALLSFKRLKEKFKNDYKGGLLFIDELDATMYPGSQRKLLEILRKYSTKLGIQVVFTTHSLTLLKLGYSLMLEANSIPATSDSIQIVYLEKKDGNIEIQEKFPFAAIENRLQNITSPRKKVQKITLYTEDKEAIAVIKAFLNGTGVVSRIDFSNCKFGKDNMINLMQAKLPYFLFPYSIVVFDGDINSNQKNQDQLKKIKGIPNWLSLPSDLSPERLLAEYLIKLSDNDPLWETIYPDYNKRVCFAQYKPDKIKKDRDVAKLWFQEQTASYRNWCSLILKSWKKSSPANAEAASKFVDSFIKLFNLIADEQRIPKIIRKKE